MAAAVRQEDIDTLPPPPPSGLDDVHGRATVNRKLSPDFFNYLRSFDVEPSDETRLPDDGPAIEVGEEDGDEVFEHTATAARIEADIDDDEISSFRDHRATAVLIAMGVALSALVAAVLLA